MVATRAAAPRLRTVCGGRQALEVAEFAGQVRAGHQESPPILRRDQRAARRGRNINRQAPARLGCIKHHQRSWPCLARCCCSRFCAPALRPGV